MEKLNPEQEKQQENSKTGGILKMKRQGRASYDKSAFQEMEKIVAGIETTGEQVEETFVVVIPKWRHHEQRCWEAKERVEKLGRFQHV